MSANPTKNTILIHMGRWRSEIIKNYLSIGGHQPEQLLKLVVKAPEMIAESTGSSIIGEGAIYAVPYIYFIENGRGPRQNNESSDLKSKIYDWMARKGLFRSGYEHERQREARGVAWYINQYGTKLWRQLRGSGTQKRMIYSNVLTDVNIRKMMEEIGQGWAVQIGSDIEKALKFEL